MGREAVDLHLEAGVSGGSADVRRRQLLTASCSVVAHSVGMVGVVAVPLLLSSVLPEPARAVPAFLVEPLVVPPPPPPPAPAGHPTTARTAPEAEPVSPATLTAPIEVPTELKPDEWLDLGIEGGLPSGVEGGIPGGVAGAIVGGLPDSTAEPPPVKPVRVSGVVKEPVKVTHVDPVYPPVAAAAKLEGVVIVEALIDVRGRVVEVRILQGDRVFADAALEAVRQWVYTPTLLDGVPVPLIMEVTVNFQLASSRGH